MKLSLIISLLLHLVILRLNIPKISNIQPIAVTIIEQPKSKPQYKPKDLFKLVDRTDRSIPKNVDHKPGNDRSPRVKTNDGYKTPFEDDKLVYASFFDRVRAQLDARWQDKVKDKLAEYFKRTNRRILKALTVVVVELNALGELISIHFVVESNNPELDAIATQAFKDCGFFPHPPADLIKNGKIVFDWAFIIDL